MSFPSVSSVIAIAALAAVVPIYPSAETAMAPLPQPVFGTTVVGMPTVPQQQVRVLTAELAPGQSTINHAHPFPVTTYVQEGAVTFTVEGQDAVTVEAGQAFVEQAGLMVTGKNPSDTETAHVVIFYVSEPGAVFVNHR